MRLSSSELLSLLKRALEGSGWTQGRYEEPARAIWWLECHGIKWLDNIPKVWSRLLQKDILAPELIRDHAGESVIEANSSSLLHYGPISVDLAYANACTENLASVETRNCTDRQLILAQLSALARRGVGALARWHTDATLHVATIQAGEHFPEYIEYAVPTGHHIDTNSLFLVCSRHSDGMNHYRRNLSKITETHSIRNSHSSDKFEQCTATTRATGIEISDDAIKLLTEAGDRVLVKASEQSRLGAG